jgi:hypothetical protein
MTLVASLDEQTDDLDLVAFLANNVVCYPCTTGNKIEEYRCLQLFRSLPQVIRPMGQKFYRLDILPTFFTHFAMTILIATLFRLHI